MANILDKKLLIVAKREYLERVRSRWFIIMTLLIPVLMSAGFVIPLYLASHNTASPNLRHIRILDATTTGLGQQIATAITSDSTLRAAGPGADSIAPRVDVVAPADLAAKEKAAIAEVQQLNHIVGVLVVTDSTAAGKSARYSGRNASEPPDMARLESIVRQTTMMHRLTEQGVRSDVVDQLTKSSLHISEERVTERGKSGSGEAGLFAGIIVGALLFVSIISNGQNVLGGVVEEKTTRVAEVVVSSVKPETLLAGKVLGVGAAGLTQQVAWFGLSLYLMGFLSGLLLKGTALTAHGAAGASPLATSSALSGLSMGIIVIALLYFIFGFIFYATLFAAAGSMVNSEQEGRQAAMPIMMLAMSGYFLLEAVTFKPNSTLSVVLSWLPWTSPILMPVRMGLTTVSPASIAGSLIVAFLGSVFAIWLSARIYRVGMLMYGKKPSMAELVKWIRYA